MAKKSDFERVLLLGDADGARLAKAPISSDVNLEEYNIIIAQPATWYRDNITLHFGFG
jgi:hypothetical protein